MPPGRIDKTPNKDLPSLGELAHLVKKLVTWRNVHKVKITGGEPLLRPGVVEFVNQLTSLDGIEEVSMITNGSRLADFADDLKQAGLSRVNISLDTVNPDRFRELAGGSLSDTLRGIDAAIDAGLQPVKLNAVLRASTWRDDVPSLLDYAAKTNLEIRFIELMSTGPAADWAVAEYVSAKVVVEWLSGKSDITHLSRSTEGPARRMSIMWKDEDLTVGWITPQSHPFCDDCNRLRLDSLGRLRRCLMDEATLPLSDLFSNSDEQAIQIKIERYLQGKRHPDEMSIDQPMVAVGG